MGKKKEFEIRTRFEYGESLKELAIIYKIPLRTLEERKKQSELKGDSWIKGFRSKEGYKEFIETNEKKKEALNIEITNRARVELIILDKMLDDFYSNGNVLLIPEVEKAFSIRSTRIQKQLSLRREIEEIYTPEQELNIKLLKIQLETKRAELKIKVEELKAKKIDIEFKKIEAKTYGVEIDEQDMSKM